MKIKITFIKTALVLAACFSLQAVSLAQSGSLDLSFDIDGILTTSVGGSDDYGNSVAIQSDGKIVVAGFSFNGDDFDFVVIRYNSNGTLDNTFDTDGKVITNIYIGTGISNDYGKSVAIQRDGKIVVVGSSVNHSGDEDIAVVRYNSNGSLDNTFSTDGILTTSIGSSYDSGNSVAIQSDGKIVVVGTSVNNFNDEDIAVVRYNSNGTLDNTFDTDGKLTTDIAVLGISDDYGNSVAIQSDGKIVVVGSTKTGLIIDIAVVRYNINGTLDNTFDTDGKITTPVGTSDDSGNSVAIQNDGKIVVLGSSNSGNTDIALVRYNNNGTLDNTFDTDGKLTIAIGISYDIGRSIAIQSNGKIVLVAQSNTYNFTLVRINSNGTLDNTFDTDGKLDVPVGSFNDSGGSVAIQSDGKIVVAGSSYNNDFDNDIGLARINSNGTLDNTFDNDGQLTTNVQSLYDDANEVAIQSDGKIVVVGRSFSGSSFDFGIVRYNSDGSLDNTFDTDGKLTTPVGSFEDFGSSVVIQSDGKIVVAGTSFNGIDYDIAVVRYNSNGSLDNTFNTDGILTTSIGTSNDFGNSVAIQSDGKIVVVGTSSNGIDDDIAVVRYNSDGSLDSTFDTDGKLKTDVGNYENGSSVAIQSNGKIVVAGSINTGTNSDIIVIRYNSDGSLDNSFNIDGRVTTSQGLSDEFGYSVAIQSDGMIVVAGTSSSGSYRRIVVVRYSIQGNLDPSFDADGILTTSFGAGLDDGYSVAIQSDGKIVVVGSSSDNIAVVRYDKNGRLDNTFDFDGKLTTNVGYEEEGSSVAIQSDGKIVVAGSSTEVLFKRFFVVARYNNNVNTAINLTVNHNIVIDIYPNPFSASTTLQTSNILNAATLSVYNTLGEQVKQINNISGQKITINRGNLPSGVYFLQLTENNQNLSLNKLVITE